MTSMDELAVDRSVDADEVARFDALAAEWWDPDGPMHPLHRLNPVRLGFIRNRLEDHFGLQPNDLAPFAGLRLLDIGCGAGLLSEPLARLGATVVAIDAAAESIAVARAHARAASLEIDYRQATAETLAGEGAEFDAVIAMEVVEHVADLGAFLAAAAALARPGGAAIFATLNRTPKSFLQAIVGAEHLLRWLPKGTHRWDRFVKPSEFRRRLAAHGIEVERFAGVGYGVLSGEWRLSGDLGVNYMVFGRKGRPSQPSARGSQGTRPISTPSSESSRASSSVASP